MRDEVERDTHACIMYHASPRVEEKISRQQLEQDARQAPHVGTCVVPHTSDNLPNQDIMARLANCYQHVPIHSLFHSDALRHHSDARLRSTTNIG